MPCYQVNTMSVELKASDRDILEEALKRLGLRYQRNGKFFTIFTEHGTITVSESESALLRGANTNLLSSKLNEIRREYSRVVVNKVAKRQRWVTRWNTSKTKATVIRG